MKENRLVEIPVEDLPKLRDLYVSRKFESVAYNLIQNFINWLKKDPSIDFAKFYSLNGDWSDGTFVLQNTYLILFETLERKSDSSRLYEALRLLDYSGLRVFNGYDSRLQSVVEKVVSELDLNENDGLNGSYDLYVLRQDVAVKRNTPKGITISPLKEVHAQEIDTIWDFRHQGSLNATQHLIKYGISLGAFTENGQLVGWIIVQQTGALGLLKVHNDFRRLGIASLLVTTISRQIAASGQNVMTLISDRNFVSKTLFQNIGFQKVEEFCLNWTFFQDNNIYIMVNTRNDSYERLFSALNCLDKSLPYLLYGFPHHIKPTIERYVTQFNLKVDSTNLSTTIWYHLPREEALKFNTDPPEGITLSSLRQEDVDTINDLWPHRQPGSEVFVGRLIALSPNIGAYDKDGILLAWCLKLPVGALGLLHVKDDQKRKGYGNLMVRVLSKKFAEQGTEVTAPVIETNVASRTMFKKLGFKEIDKVYWVEKPALK